MTPDLFLASILMVYNLSFSAACFILAGICSTLYEAFTLTGYAGIMRMAEKFPTAKDRLQKWDGRWDVLRATLLLGYAAFLISGISLAMMSITSNGTAQRHVLLITIIASAFAFIVVLRLLRLALSETYADRISVRMLPLVAIPTYALYPLAYALSRLEQKINRVVREGSQESDRPSAEDEIRSVVDQASMESLEEDEKEIIHSVLEFGDTVTREIMTPRVDIEGLEDEFTVAQCVEVVKSSSRSRFPIFHDTLDDILGLVHIKDLLRLMGEGHGSHPIIQAEKPVPFVPESMHINDLLNLLRGEKAQMAIVVDEYGGTAGLVTVEDIVEELVGEIYDEYDTQESGLQKLSDGSIILAARTPVDEVNDVLKVNIPQREEYDSVGGYVFHELGRIPHPGETIDGDNFHITVQTANARQLHTLRVLKKTDSSTAA